MPGRAYLMVRVQMHLAAKKYINRLRKPGQVLNLRRTPVALREITPVRTR